MCELVTTSNTLSSPNFWTAISGFGGAIVGAITGSASSYFVQRALEKKSRKQKNFSHLLEAFNQLSALYDFAKEIKESTETNRNLPLRHLNIPFLFIYYPTFEDRSFFSSLAFIAKDNGELLEDMEHYRARGRMLLLALERRNKIHETSFQPRVDEIFPSSTAERIVGDVAPDDLIRKLGKNLYYNLKSYTDALYENTDYITGQFPKLEPKIMSLLNSKW